jgi:hypothetical protein
MSLAAYVLVPVHKRAVRIVAPSPDVQFEKRRYSEPVRTLDELKCLAFELGWSVVMSCQQVAASTMYSTPTSRRRLPIGS